MRWFLLGGFLLAALNFAVGDDLTTLKGTIYRNYTVVRAGNGFLSISYEEGTANIKAEALPEDIRTKYGLTSSDIPAALVSGQPSHLDQLVLNDGTRYTNVKVVGIRADALSILYDDGGATIPFEKLSDATCKLYGITEEKALAYRSSVTPSQQTAVVTTENTNAAPVAPDATSPNYTEYSTPAPTTTGGGEYVHGYYRKNGTYVHGYYRSR
jgi:hypothetical protein